ncbi:MAG TPA: endolytic transglycosylase MltG [Chitinophagales bacterium]
MKGFIALLLIALIAVGVFVFYIGNVNNINSDRESVSINIRNDADFDKVLQLLKEKKMLHNVQTFSLVARFKNYNQNIKGGHYIFAKRMNNREIVNMLKVGLQSPVKFTTYNIQTKEDFAGAIARNLDIDSISVLNDLYDENFCAARNSNTENVLATFIYSSFEMKWNSDKKVLYDSFEIAYKRFWNEEREAKASALNLTKNDVEILASIVEKECMVESELPIIAGVYLNRLRIKMPLQADPTLKFAAKEFDAKRVNNSHKSVESEYNTYKHKGLPPGPICLPRKKSVDAVLNAEKHDFLYFCANPDMSGNSVFSRTLEEQNRVAVEYRKKLNALNIH